MWEGDATARGPARSQGPEARERPAARRASGARRARPRRGGARARRSVLDEAARELDAVPHAELVEDRLEVALHRLRGDAEPLRDLARAEPVRDEQGDLAFTLGEPIGRARPAPAPGRAAPAPAAARARGGAASCPCRPRSPRCAAARRAPPSRACGGCPGGPSCAPSVSPRSSAGTARRPRRSGKKTFSISSACRSHRSSAAGSQWAAAPRGAGTRTFARIMATDPLSSPVWRRGPHTTGL